MLIKLFEFLIPSYKLDQTILVSETEEGFGQSYV